MYIINESGCPELELLVRGSVTGKRSFADEVIRQFKSRGLVTAKLIANEENIDSMFHQGIANAFASKIQKYAILCINNGWL